MIKSMRVYGIPEGQERPRFGNGRFYSPKNAWWKAVIMQARLTRPERLLAGPLAVHFVYLLPRPRSTPTWVVWCPQKPDFDNIDKATADAMTQSLRWWSDDKQIVFALTEKRYVKPGENSGAFVEAREISEAPPDVEIKFVNPKEKQ